jgi:hypothetical protein
MGGSYHNGAWQHLCALAMAAAQHKDKSSCHDCRLGTRSVVAERTLVLVLQDLVANLEEQIAELQAEMKKDFSTLASRGGSSALL